MLILIITILLCICIIGLTLLLQKAYKANQDERANRGISEFTFWQYLRWLREVY